MDSIILISNLTNIISLFYFWLPAKFFNWVSDNLMLLIEVYALA